MKKVVVEPKKASVPIVVIPRCPGGHPMHLGSKAGDRCPLCDRRVP